MFCVLLLLDREYHFYELASGFPNDEALYLGKKVRGLGIDILQNAPLVGAAEDVVDSETVRIDAHPDCEMSHA